MKTYLRVLGYLRVYKFRIAVLIFCSIAMGVCFGGSVLTALPMLDLLLQDMPPDTAPEELFDGIFWQSEFGQTISVFVMNHLFVDRYRALVWIAALIIVITLLRGVFRFWVEYLGGFISQHMAVDISNRMYRSILDLSLDFYEKTGVGNAMSRFSNDVNMVNRGITSVLTHAVADPARILVSVAILVYINPRLAAIGLVGFPFIGVCLMEFGRKIKRAIRRTLERKGRVVSILQETVSGIMVVKAFVAEKYEVKRFMEANRRMLRYAMKAVKVDAASAPIMEVFATIGIAIFFLVGGFDVLNGKMDLPEFLVFCGAFGTMIDPVRKLSKMYNNMQVSIAAADRVFEFIDATPTVSEKTDAHVLPPFKDAIEFRGVDLSYNPTDKVLEDVDLRVDRGQIVALVGLSGAGKTSIANLVIRFYDVSSGSVTVDGIDVRDVTLESLRAQIGVVTQETVLFNDTVGNNIAYGQTDCPDERIVAAAKAAYAHEFIEQLPHGYDTVIGDRGSLLSGGQRQRLAIARAILKDPAILILDEATSSLDSESEQKIQLALERFVEGRTTLVIAHRLSTVMRADKIVVVHEGRIVETGTHEQLIGRDGHYKRLYDSQFQV